MKHQRGIFVVAAALLLGVSLPQAASAADEGCVFSGARLDCTDGRKKARWSQVTRAFASEQTRKLLADPLEELDRFKKPITREHFRKSVEKSWAIVNKYDQYSRAQLKKKKITAEEYHERVALHQQALESYRAAYWFYKNLNWQAQ